MRPQLRSGLVSVIGTFLAALVHSGPVRADVILDDFNDGNDIGWARYNPLAPFGGGGTYSFPNGGYRLQALASPNPATLGPGRLGASRPDTPFPNFRGSVDLVAWNNTIDQVIGISARNQETGLGTSDGYLFSYNTISQAFPGGGAIRLGRIDNEAVTNIAQAPLTLDPNQDYRLVFTGIGPRLTGQVFNLSDLTTPLATLAINDGTYRSGVLGLVVFNDNFGSFNGPADATFDNFRAEATPEPTSLTLFAAGVVGVLGPVSLRRKFALFRISR